MAEHPNPPIPMPETLHRLDTPPQWATDIFKEIDTLEFGAGFAHLTSETKFSFGTTQMIGVEAIKQFFHQIDDGLDTVHRIYDVWDGGKVKILRGDADLSRAGSGDEPVIDPIMMIFSMTDDDPEVIDHWVSVNGPTRTNAVV